MLYKFITGVKNQFFKSELNFHIFVQHPWEGGQVARFSEH